MFTVATSSTPQLADYLTWDTVWFFHLPLNTTYSIAPSGSESDSRVEAWFNLDWETIAQQALESGHCSGASVHVITQSGWRSFYSGELMAPYFDTRDYPVYGQDYGIFNSAVTALGVTVDHVYRFVSAFRSRGMKVGFYFQEHEARNLMAYGGGSESATARLTYLNYLKREIAWLNKMYEPDFWWCDHPYLTTFSDAQRDDLYQTLKTIPGTGNTVGPLVIHNTADYNVRMPCDIMHAEHPNGLFPSDSQYNATTVIGSGTYAGTWYIPKGMAFTGLYYTSTPTPSFPYQWNAYINPVPDGVTTYNLVRDQAWFNTQYKFCKDRGLPAFINMPPIESGLIPTYLTRVTNLSAA